VITRFGDRDRCGGQRPHSQEAVVDLYSYSDDGVAVGGARAHVAGDQEGSSTLVRVGGGPDVLGCLSISEPTGRKIPLLLPQLNVFAPGTLSLSGAILSQNGASRNPAQLA